MAKEPKKKNSLVTAEKDFGAAAFIPMMIFLALYLGSGIYFTVKGAESPFAQVPRDSALVIGVVAALFMGKRSFSVKTNRFAEASGSPGIMLEILIFVLAGVFSGVSKGMGGVDAVVNMGLSVIPKQLMVPGVFVISAAIATAMGTSMGTVAAVGPIAVGLAETGGYDMALTMSAVICGGMFGDNLSIISDTTIAATRGAGCDMRDKFKMNFKIAFPAAILACIVYGLMSGGAASISGEYLFNPVKIIPYIAVLAVALTGVDVVIVLVGGIALSGAVGFLTGSLDFVGFCKAASGGISGMLSIILIAILLKGLVTLIQDMGGINWLLAFADRNIKSRKGAQYFIALFVSILDFCVGNNAVCIIMSAEVLKPLAKKFNVSPQRFASLLDIFACIIPGISPIGMNVLLGVSYASLSSPLPIIKNAVYLYLLAAFALATIQFDLLKTKEEKEHMPFYPELDDGRTV